MPPCHSFDPQALLAAVDHNEQIMHVVLAAFPAWQDTVSAKLEAARTSVETTALAQVAHDLRGTLAQLHADRAASLANEIELACQQPEVDVDRLQELLLRMQKELSKIAQEISAFLAGSTPA